MMEETIRLGTSASIKLTNVELCKLVPIIHAELLDNDDHINVPVASPDTDDYFFTTSCMHYLRKAV